MKGLDSLSVGRISHGQSNVITFYYIAIHPCEICFHLHETRGFALLVAQGLFLHKYAASDLCKSLLIARPIYVHASIWRHAVTPNDLHACLQVGVVSLLWFFVSGVTSKASEKHFSSRPITPWSLQSRQFLDSS